MLRPREGAVKLAESQLKLPLVPGGGIEPPRYRYRRILSPVRLPIPPSRLPRRIIPQTSAAHNGGRLTSINARSRNQLTAHAHEDRRLRLRPAAGIDRAI